MSFKAGDVCVLLPHPLSRPSGWGKHVRLIKFVGDAGCATKWTRRWQVEPIGWPGYHELTPDESILSKHPAEPQREELGSWDLCPWQPKEVRV